MTGMLASVNCMEEAVLVMAENVDIIDLKNPAMGSLGALDNKLVKSIVEAINGACQTSATIGDLPMQPELMVAAVQAMAKTGVDYVKIGFFPDKKTILVIDKLRLLAGQTHLIAVLFADMLPEPDLMNSLVDAGFRGLMLDTMDKSRGSLTDMLSLESIEQFVAFAKANQCLCGLAGSLRYENIPLLLPLNPDYLGFRGGLCENQSRTGQVHRPFVRSIKQTLTNFSN